jgi:Cu-Zn family superoxide dismutase
MRMSAARLTASLSVLGLLTFATLGGCSSDSNGTTGRGGSGGSAGGAAGSAGSGSGGSSGGTGGTGGTGGGRASIALTIASLGTSTATGTAMFEKLSSGEIKLTVMVSGVAPASAQHGIHIHANGSCADASDGDGGTTIGGGAGGHWNPDAHMHGSSPTTNHLGDIGNIMVDASGAGSLTFMTTAWTMDTGAANDIVNHALILHASPDDGTTQPTGNAGGRIGCVVIQ